MLRKDLPEPRRKAPDEVVNSTMRDDDGVTEAARLCTRDSTNRASHTHSSLHSHSTSSWEVRGRKRWSYFCQQQPLGNIIAKKCVSALHKNLLVTVSLKSKHPSETPNISKLQNYVCPKWSTFSRTGSPLSVSKQNWRAKVHVVVPYDMQFKWLGFLLRFSSKIVFYWR